MIHHCVKMHHTYLFASFTHWHVSFMMANSTCIYAFIIPLLKCFQTIASGAKQRMSTQSFSSFSTCPAVAEMLNLFFLHINLKKSSSLDICLYFMLRWKLRNNKISSFKLSFIAFIRINILEMRVHEICIQCSFQSRVQWTCAFFTYMYAPSISLHYEIRFYRI